MAQHLLLKYIQPVVCSGVNLRLSTDTPEEAEAETETHERPRSYEQTGGDAALKLQHAVYTLTCIVWQQLTTIHRYLCLYLRENRLPKAMLYEAQYLYFSTPRDPSVCRQMSLHLNGSPQLAGRGRIRLAGPLFLKLQIHR